MPQSTNVLGPDEHSIDAIRQPLDEKDGGGSLGDASADAVLGDGSYQQQRRGERRA